MSTERRHHTLAISALFISAQAFGLSAMAQTPETAATRSNSGMTTPAAADHSTMAHPGQDKKSHDGMKSGSAKSLTAESFAMQAATIDKAELEFAQLAMKNSKDAAVRKYAEQMTKDHTATTAKLKTIAAKENLMLPQTLDAEHAAVKTQLAGLQGQEFDAAYSKEMAKGHEKALALFESASQTPQITGDLKQFAASTLPKLREHETMAASLHSKEGG